MEARFESSSTTVSNVEKTNGHADVIPRSEDRQSGDRPSEERERDLKRTLYPRSVGHARYRYLVSRGAADYTGGLTLGLFPPTTMRPEGPVFITTNPSLQSIKMPAFTRVCQIPEREIREISDYDKKLERIADRYLDH